MVGVPTLRTCQAQDPGPSNTQFRGRTKAQTELGRDPGHAGGVLKSELWPELVAPAPKSENFKEARENRPTPGKTP